MKLLCKNNVFQVFLVVVFALNGCSNNSQKSEIPQPNIPEIPDTFDYCPKNTPNAYDNYTLEWVDNFSDSVLDEAIWNYMYGDGSNYGIPGWGNNEKQIYGDNENNVYLANGCLFIIPTYSDGGYTSARLNSSGNQLFQFGKIDVSFSVPEMTGVWPALWFLPEYYRYGGWPKSGEIDLMETVNTKSNELFTTVHYGHDYHRFVGKTTYLNQLTKLTNPDDHNVMSLEWDEEGFEWLLNGASIYQLPYSNLDALNPNPFLEQFHMLINVAVGGNFPGDPRSDEYCRSRENCPDVKKLVVDYVAYYRKND